MQTSREIAPGVREIGKIDVEVPDLALIGCPVIGFKLRSPKDCATCEHFLGLQDRFPGADDKPFSVRFLIACRGEVKSRAILMRAA